MIEKYFTKERTIIHGSKFTETRNIVHNHFDHTFVYFDPNVTYQNIT